MAIIVRLNLLARASFADSMPIFLRAISWAVATRLFYVRDDVQVQKPTCFLIVLRVSPSVGRATIFLQGKPKELKECFIEPVHQ